MPRISLITPYHLIGFAGPVKEQTESPLTLDRWRVRTTYHSDNKMYCYNFMATSFARMDPFWFFFWGFIKDRVFVTLPADLHELRITFMLLVAEVMCNVLARVWNEIDFRWDVCCITNGAHIKPKWLLNENLDEVKNKYPEVKVWKGNPHCNFFTFIFFMNLPKEFHREIIMLYQL